ncbi:MAG: hypothetical protein JXB88_23730 [Spirochaetales bacterium]|nr:hypothetical protein [Spirochaetales bacterium]
MVYLEGLKKIERVQWKDIQAGMIFLGGIRINDTVPFELRDFPVLSPSLIEDLTKRYYFLSKRDILVARVKTGYSPSKLSRNLKDTRETIEKIAALRSAFVSKKEEIFKKSNLPVTVNTRSLDTNSIEKSYLIKDVYNSFSIPGPSGQDIIPSLFHTLTTPITLGHLLTGKIYTQFHLPLDEEILFHLVVDFSGSMRQERKLDIVFSCLHFFHTELNNLLTHTEMKLYAFSHECRPAHFPLTGKELPGRESNYSSFIKKVLHFKDTARHNYVILFTDSTPADLKETLYYGRLFKKNNIDYTQIIFGAKDDESGNQLSMRYDNLTRVAETCGGNQIIVNVHEVVPVIALEDYDRYLGFLTLTDPFYQNQSFRKQENTQTVTSGKNGVTCDEGKKIKGKVIKKWQPKIIRRPD